MLKLISFGDVGEELLGFFHKEPKHMQSISKKLIDAGFLPEDIAWICTHLSIEQVNEEALKNAILSGFKQNIMTMAAPEVVFDVLTSYISVLSRYAKATSKEQWDEKLNALARDFTALSGICSQYGKTILPLNEYKNIRPIDVLANEYRIGSNTHPEHIRLGLDIIRDAWCGEIHQKFIAGNNIVIIKAASGQGKSSLAYRYLIDHYPEKYVLVINALFDRQQAADIVGALNGLSATRAGELIVYLDVPPYNTEWLSIAKVAGERGFKLNLLITIREEDYNRTIVNIDELHAALVEVHLNKAEAEEVFNKCETASFLNFEEAWSKFGGEGPFMEFMYLLTQGDTLKNKLELQVKQIVEHESDADSWLNMLQVISFAGQYSLSIDVAKLNEAIQPRQYRKMLAHFEKEYFVKIHQGSTVDILHPVRGRILYEIIQQNSNINEEVTLIYAIATIRGFFQIVLIEYFAKNFNDISQAVGKLLKIKLESWTAYASILSALLWVDAFIFYQKNKHKFDQGFLLVGEAFITLFIRDMTGLFFDVSETSEAILKIFKEKLAPEKYASLIALINSIHPRSIDFFYTDLFTSCYKDIDWLTLNNNPQYTLSEIGFVLFWLAQRGIQLESVDFTKFLSELSRHSMYSIADFILGLQVQNKNDFCQAIRTHLLPLLSDKKQIVYLDCNSDVVTADFILDFLSENSGEEIDQKKFNVNDQVMDIVIILRKIFYDKSRYHVTAIGVNVDPGVLIPDTEKNIEVSNLPIPWLTNLNYWICNLDEYQYRPDNWEACIDNLAMRLNVIQEYVESFNKVLDHYYKKGKPDKFISENFSDKGRSLRQALKHQIKLPKCRADKYGLQRNSQQDSPPSVASIKNIFASPARDNIESLFRVFIEIENSISNFQNQAEKCIVSLFNQKLSIEKCRLPLINLVKASSLYFGIQRHLVDPSFELMKKLSDSNIYENLILLSDMWQFFISAAGGISKGASSLYKQKENIKALRKKLKAFFTSSFMCYQHALDHKAWTVTVMIDIEQVDIFCTELFRNFKKNFPNISVASPEYALMKEDFNEINLLLTVGDCLMPGGFAIQLDQLALCDSLETFMRLRQPLAPQEVTEISRGRELPKISAIYCIAHIEMLVSLYSHAANVLDRISAYNNSPSFCENGFSRWEALLEGKHKELISFIIQYLNALAESAPLSLENARSGLIRNFEEISSACCIASMMEMKNTSEAMEAVNHMRQACFSFLDALDI